VEPAVQYTLTEDGASVAYWTLGSGRPLVVTPAWEIAGSTRTWQNANGRAWMERLAARHQLARFDYRGFGLSQAEDVEVTLESHVADLAAVIDALGGPVDLFGYMASAPVVIAYAAEHPASVAHLIIWCGAARGAAAVSPATQQALDMLLEADWELYTEAVAANVRRSVGNMDAAQYAASLRESLTPAMARAYNARPALDATEFLPRVSVPTLILHRRGVQLPSLHESRAMAARIPGARLAVVEGGSAIPYVGDVDAVVDAIDEFLAAPDVEPVPEPVRGGLLTILFTDLVSSTALTRQLGDERAQELVRRHNTIVREALHAHQGSEIKHTGDGIMASFLTASGAIACAIAIQRTIMRGPTDEMAVHIGLNAGEPVVEDRDLFGTSVQMARRICDHATAGQIVVANVVRELAAGKGFLFADLGDVIPKGFEEPVRLYEVGWEDESGPGNL
jgi:class 3 adenylate cyclase